MAATSPRTNGRGPRVPLAVTPSPAPEPPRASVATPSLDAAVMRVQAAAPKFERNAPGQIQNRIYHYVTLDAIVEEVHPLLVDQGLVWKSFPTIEDGQPALRYRMTHIDSGEFDEDTMPLLCDPTSQGLGSAITYARRYSLVAYLNLTVDPDDDGLSANAPPSRDRYAEAEAAHSELDKKSNSESGSTVPAAVQPVARPPQPSERRITANQRTKLLIPRAQKAGLTDAEFANVILVADGAEPRTWSTDEHAKQTLDRLLDKLPARLKDPVLDGIKKAAEAKP